MVTRQKRLNVVMFCVSLMFFSCKLGLSTGAAEQLQQIAFESCTGRYLLKNTYQILFNPSFLIFNNYSSFDSLFEWGAIPGQDSSPIVSQSSMHSNMIIAVVISGTFSTTITVQNITLRSSILSIYYTNSTSLSHPSFISNNIDLVLAADCSYDSVRFYENNQIVDNPHVERH